LIIKLSSPARLAGSTPAQGLMANDLNNLNNLKYEFAARLVYPLVVVSHAQGGPAFYEVKL